MDIDDDRLRATVLYQKTLGCLLGGLIGDAIGTPTENKHYRDIAQTYGWVTDFATDGTDDTVMKNLLCDALISTAGYATADDWAQVWLDNWNVIFGEKRAMFYISVIHTAYKLKRSGAPPRMAALGNLPSSSSAMCISPVGIVNACNPGQAAAQAYSLASLIHVHDVGFCQDGAACIAAAVSEAMKPAANVDSIIAAAKGAPVPLSGREMRDRIDAMLDLARETQDYTRFRESAYARADTLFCTIMCDARETVPLTLALLWLARGDMETAVTYAANFGRDSDTIGTMAGAIAGALHGVHGIKGEWVTKAQQVTTTNQAGLAMKLVQTALAKHARESAAGAVLDSIAAA